LIAMTILAVALVPILGTMSSSFVTGQGSEDISQGTRIAASYIERAKLDPTRVSSASAPWNGMRFAHDARYDCKIVVQDLDPSLYYKRVEVFVYLKGQDTPLVTLVTYIMQGGV